MRALAILAVFVLAGCAASAQTSAPASRGSAYVDLARVASMPEWRAFYAAYDREASALRATQHVPQLADTRPVAAHQAEVVRNGARDAAAALDDLKARAAGYQPQLPDASNVRSRMESNYATQAADVRGRSGASAQQYRDALQRETATQLAAYRASLDARVNGAYAARAQQLREKEADLQIKLARRDADADLLLRVKLQNLKSPQVDRGALRAKLNALEARENRAMSALQAQDAATLAAYRAQLVASATRDYASMTAELSRKAQANWALRERVSQQQAQAPQTLDLAPLQAATFTTQWSQFGDSTAKTSAAFSAGADDIARRFSAIAQMDTDARGSAANEIIALRQDRASLDSQVRRAARAVAQRIAQQRGLTLVETRQPGAVDLTPQVLRELRLVVNGGQ